MAHTDRLGGVFPGDVVVEVGIVRGAANLELLPNNAHIFICLQEDVRRETELWNERKPEMSTEWLKNLISASCLADNLSHSEWC